MKEGKNVIQINLNDILPNRFQPRIKFNEKSIVELSESIKEHGVIQPIIVRKISDKFEIIAGERRYKASVLAGKTDIPAIIVDLNDKDSSEIALIENVQREDLTAIEEAISYRKILDMGYLTQEALANRLGIAQSTIANKIRLLNLDDDVQEALLDGKISERHARSLLKLSPSLQKKMLDKIISERLTVRKTDEVINDMLKNETVLDSLNANVSDMTPTNDVVVAPSENPFLLNNMSSPSSPNVEVLDLGYADIKAPNANIPSSPIIEDDVVVPQMPVQKEIPAMSQPAEVIPQPVAYSTSVEMAPQIPVQEEIPAMTQPAEVIPQPVAYSTSVEMAPQMPVQEEIPVMIPTQPIIEDNSSFEGPSPMPIPTAPIQKISVEEPIQEEVHQNRFFTMMAPQPEEIPVQIDNSVMNNQSEKVVPPVELAVPDSNLNIFDSSAINNQQFVPTQQVSITPETVAPIQQIPVENNIFNAAPVYQNAVPTPEMPIQNFEQPVIEDNSDDTEIEDTPIDIVESDEPIIQQVVPLTVDQPMIQTVPVQEESYNLRDVINKMRKCADEIEAMGFEIDTEEFDFDDMYQVIFKIKK